VFIHSKNTDAQKRDFQPFILFLRFVLVAELFGAGVAGAAGSNADPVRPVLVTEPGVVGSIAGAICYWADPKRTVLLAQLSLHGEGGAGRVHAHYLRTAAVLAAEPGRPTLSVGGTTWGAAKPIASVLGAEPSSVHLGGAPLDSAHTLRTPTVLDAETSRVGAGGAAWVDTPQFFR
jgi:hypothetical protein